MFITFMKFNEKPNGHLYLNFVGYYRHESQKKGMSFYTRFSLHNFDKKLNSMSQTYY